MTKKIYILAVIIFYAMSINAQDIECNKKVETQLKNKIKPFKSIDLIPYYSEKEKKWGYFHRLTKKIITKPIMDSPYFFEPNINFSHCFETNGLENGCDGRILGSKDNYKIELSENAQYQYPEESYTSVSTEKKFKSRVKDDINGFEVDENGVLTNFNHKFYDEENDKILIRKIIFFKNIYYAIITLYESGKNYFSIINQDGQEFFNFKKTECYPSLKQIYTNDSDLWFLTQTKNGKYTYKSLLNNIQLELAFDSDAIYGENQEQSFGYVIYTLDKKPGVLDLTTMKWKINPSENNDFQYLFFASSEPLSYSYKKDEWTYKPDAIISNKDIEDNRKKSYLYIQSSKNAFYDLELKIYKQKK
jgi:hypothetical protein